jgi:hypothetical protein
MAVAAESVRRALALILTGAACVEVNPKLLAQDPPVKEALSVFLVAIPWDSLCAASIARECGVIRIDTLIYQSEHPLLDPNEALVVATLRASDLAMLSNVMNRSVIPGAFTQRITEGDTLDVSIVRIRDAPDGDMRMLADIALPDDIGGYHVHARMRRTGSGWTLVQRWILEG